MRRFKRIVVPILMTLSLGFLMGDDCEFEIDDWPGINVIGWDPYDYDYIVVEEPVYYYDDYWW